MPAPKRLCHNRDEGYPLLSAELLSHPALVFICNRHCVASSDGRSCPGGVLERVGDGDVQGGVQPASPVGEEHVSRPSVVARDKSTPLLERSKASSSCRVMKGIPNCIMPHNALTTSTTDHAVVAQDVAFLTTAWAGSWLVIDWEAQPELAGNDKLSAPKMETKGLEGGAVEPSPSFWEAE